jgi:hypothetical protein
METGVERGPRIDRASPPGMSLLRRKTIMITPRMTMIACAMRLRRNPITRRQPYVRVGSIRDRRI